MGTTPIALGRQPRSGARLTPLIPPLAVAIAAGIALFSLHTLMNAAVDTFAVVTVPATSAGVLLASFSLLLVAHGNGPVTRELGSWFAIATAVLGTVVLAHYAADWIGAFPGLRLFTGERWWNMRPGSVTGAGLATLGLALLATTAPEREAVRRAGFYIAVTLVIAMMGIVGHAYGASALYGLNRWGGTAVSTAIALGALAVGAVFADPTRGVAAVFTSPTAGGHVMRRLVPGAILAPIVLGWSVLVLMEMRQVDAAFGIAILVMGVVIVLVALAVRQAIVADGLAAERELMLSRERSARAQVTDILESITDAFFAVDRAWRFTYVNSEAERLLRRPRQDLLGHSLWEVFPEGVGAIFHREYQRARDEQRTVQFEAQFAPIDLWFHVRAYPTPEGLSVYFHDITQRKADEERLRELLGSEKRARAEEELRRAQLENVTESRARLMRGFSHDVRNPLGVADAQAWLLEQGGKVGALNDRQQAGIARIRRSIRGSLTLIEDLLEITRADDAEMDLQHVEVDVTQVAREAVEDYEAPAEAAGLTLEILAPPSLAASTDPARVRQILANLLSNAVKYAAKGRVTVEAREVSNGGPRAGTWVALSVRDTGPGIPREDFERVFEEFARLDAGAQPGAGIGLAISRRIARLLGGDLTLASELGKGSTFTLWLPK